ncbi:hypothetical protein PLCT2_02062 [Planctomycetaceae bacterium]|nr:hypothetical protein PLCT2_02062 [Planctomycetaceae bacterium]
MIAIKFAAFALFALMLTLPSPPMADAAPPPVALQQGGKRDKLRTSLQSKEKAAREKAAKAVEALANWCAKSGGYSDAIHEWSRAALLRNDFELAQKEVPKLLGKSDSPVKDYANGLETQRKKAADASTGIWDVIAEARQKDGEDFVRELSALWAGWMGADDQLEKAGWGWCEKTGSMAPKDDIVRFEAGELRHEGAWVDAAKVEALDQAHANFKLPWMLDDGFSQIQTNLGLLAAQRLLNYATRFRLYFAHQFAVPLQLKKPAGLLPLVITKTRVEYREQCTRRYGSSFSDTGLMGTYLGIVGEKLCAIVISREYPADGKNWPLRDGPLLHTLRHELTHQLCMEGLKAREPTREWPRFGVWAVEGLATNMEYQFEIGPRFEFRNVRRQRLSDESETKGTELRLSYLIKDKQNLRKVEEVGRFTDADFNTAQLTGYAESCAVVMFLLNHSASTRAKILQFLLMAHIKQVEKDGFDKCMKGEDFTALNAAFREWLDTLQFVEE